MSPLEILLRLSLVRAELLAIAKHTDDASLRELAEYMARILIKARRSDAN